MTPARERVLAVVLCAAGAGLLLLAASQRWVEVVVAEPGFPRVVVEGSGRSLAGSTAALGLVGLAGALALLATGRVGRTVTGVVLAIGGLAAAWQSFDVGRDLAGSLAPLVATAVGRDGVEATSVTSSGWPWVGVVGGVLLAAGGLLAALRGRRWPVPARRYDPDAAGGSVAAAPSSATAAESADAWWKAQDRGEDPTDGAAGDATGDSAGDEVDGRADGPNSGGDGASRS